MNKLKTEIIEEIKNNLEEVTEKLSIEFKNHLEEQLKTFNKNQNEKFEIIDKRYKSLEEKLSKYDYILQNKNEEEIKKVAMIVENISNGLEIINENFKKFQEETLDAKKIFTENIRDLKLITFDNHKFAKKYIKKT